MATFNRHDIFTDNLTAAKHDFTAHVYKVMLTNTAPIAANAVKADLTDISAGNGYTAGGTASTISRTTAAGVETIKGTNVVFTASGGSIGPFRYAALYNDTQTTPLRPLVCWWDYGSAVTLLTGESFTVDTAGDSSDVLFTVG